MKNLKLYIIEIILFISIIVFNIVINNVYCLYTSVILLSIAAYYFYGFFKDNAYSKGNVIRIVLSCVLSFFIIIYGIGLITGFNKGVFSLDLVYIFKAILLEVVFIVCSELLRYIIARRSMKNITPIVIYTFLLCLLNIMIEINGLDFSDRELVFIFISITVIPVISREFLCSYLTYKVSYVPSLLFKLVITLYPLILPIVPNLGNYLYSVTNIILVYLIYLFSSNTIVRANKKAFKYSKKVSRGVIYIPILVVLVLLIVLVSGIFKYRLIAIASNSMKPIYERGDAVIYEKVNVDDLNVGDIIAFKKEGVIITHRIVVLEKNDKYYIKTKGDHNNSIDYFELNSSEILGKVKYKINYIGYPTIWVNELLKGKEIGDD